MSTIPLNRTDRDLEGPAEPLAHQLARKVWAAFVLAFALSRSLVFLIMAGRLPDVHAHLGGTHLHHFNYGIFFLAGVGAVLLFARPTGRWLSTTAVLYGIGLGLTFDEFGMWLHLTADYWQRASFDAIVVIGALLGLLATAPTLKRFRPHHWVTALALVVVLALFGLLLVDSFRYAGRRLHPLLEEIQPQTPR